MSRVRIKWVKLLFFTVTGAFLELAGIAMFVPLLLLLLENKGIEKNYYLNKIYISLDVDGFGSFLIIMCVAVLVFTIVKNLLLHLISKYINRSLLKVYARCSENLFENYFNRGLLFIKENSPSALSHNTNSVCYSYVFNVLGPALIMAGDVLLALFIIISLAFVNIYIAAMEVLLFLPLLLFYNLKIGGRLQKTGKEDNEAKRGQWRITMETFRGYAEVEVNGAFPKLVKLFRKGVTFISNCKVRSENLKSMASKSIEVGVIAIIVGVIAGCYFIDSKGADFRILIGLFSIATLKLMPTVRSVISQYSLLKSNLFTLDVIKELNPDEQEKKGLEFTDDRLPFEDKIEIRDVNFCYAGRDSIIQDLSLVINKGEKIGIKGISGSGKSTLLYLMLGLYKPSSGGIYIDNKMLTPFNRKEWYKRIGYVSQDMFIMDATMAENIVLAESMDENKLAKAIERSSLMELVESLPMGVHTRIGDGGCKLSGGEKQRVAIARALYKNADVLLLDEPTSSLDDKTANEIAGVLEHPSFKEQKMTIVIVSHRDSLLSICERVIDLAK